MQTVVGGVLAFITLESRSAHRLRWRILLEHGLDKLTWRRPIGYINEGAPLS